MDHRMERENKKRGREGNELMSVLEEESERGRERDAKKVRMNETCGAMLDDDGNFLKKSGTDRPLGVFEFPWQQEGLAAAETDGCDLRDVFFSSLVDGCSASIGFPGDRLFQAPAGLSLLEERDEDMSWPSDGEPDGLDCIWSCVLGQPLSAVYNKGSSA